MSDINRARRKDTAATASAVGTPTGYGRYGKGGGDTGARRGRLGVGCWGPVVRENKKHLRSNFSLAVSLSVRLEWGLGPAGCPMF